MAWSVAYAAYVLALCAISLRRRGTAAAPAAQADDAGAGLAAHARAGSRWRRWAAMRWWR